ncbi:MAG TPA: histidine phosphatase family protein [Pirellulales bacterium]|nr:histidine phosphatase family protein [Pirellulales bacterium]
MKIFCARHGETLHNVAGRIQGQSNSQLSPLGRRQCQALAEALAGFEIDAIISSPLSRALETAQCVAERLQLDVQLDERWMEIHAGIFQGFGWHELDARFPAEYQRWRSQDPDYRIPGGESRRDLMLRTEQALGDIREAGYRQAVVIAHGGSLSAALKALLGIPAGRNPFTLANASISTVLWEKEFKLLSLNDTAHLAGAVSEGADL